MVAFEKLPSAPLSRHCQRLWKSQEATGALTPGAWSLPGVHAVTWWGFQSLSNMITVSADWSSDARPPSPGAEQEDEVLGLGSLKVFQQHPVIRFL